MTTLEAFRRKDRAEFYVNSDYAGACRAYRNSSKEQLAALKRRIAKPSERRRLKEQLARKRATKIRKAVEHLKVKEPLRRPPAITDRNEAKRQVEIIRKINRRPRGGKSCVCCGGNQPAPITLEKVSF